MSLETGSSPAAPYFLRKDKFFFSQENPVYSEQKAFLEEHISNQEIVVTLLAIMMMKIILYILEIHLQCI